MRKILTVFIVFILAFCLVLSACSKKGTADTGVDGSKSGDVGKHNPLSRIMIVFSTEQENLWTKQVKVGISHFLTNKEYEIEEIYLNILPQSDDNFKINAGQMAINRFNIYQPGIVLAVDDPAQQYFARHLIGRTDVDIVFCGLEKDPSIYNYPQANVTGIMSRPQIKQTLQLLDQLISGIETYTLITDKSDKSELFLRYIKGSNLKIDMDILQTDNLDDWMSIIKNLKSDAVIFYNYDKISGAEGPAELMDWTVQNLTIPSIAFTEAAIEKGILLGIIESGYEHGAVAAKSVNKIVEGKKPNQIVIALGREGLSYINKNTAVKLGLNYNNLDFDKELE